MELAHKISLAQNLLNEIEEELRLARSRASLLAHQNYPQLNEEDFKAFLKEPYVLVPKKGHEWYCVVPRWVDFSVGWLERATSSYNLFLINRYTLWLGDVPVELREATGLEKPPGDLQVLDGKLLFNKHDKPVAEHYKKYLSRVHADSGVIMRGREFDLLAQLIEDGYLPFVPRAVAEMDRRPPEVKFNFDGKYAFQREAYTEFMHKGAVGIYWMTSAGKSFVAMAALDFADSIEFGTTISKRLSLPHIHGGTTKRMEVARNSKAFVASRVMDEGVSLNDLEHIIEADFLFGSRRQEVQRTGRLLHSNATTEHDIIMTREEFDNYGKRLHGLVEKGFKVNVHQ